MQAVEAEGNARRPWHVLEDYLTIPEFAAALKVSERTVRNWMNAIDGLPYSKIGARRLINVPRARVWIASREVQRNPRRKMRGRSGP